MKKIHIIDTSVLLCLLKIPNFCSRTEVLAVTNELIRIIENKETLIMPIASIIETGNHIAHIRGNLRRAIAERFAQYLKDTADNEAPWTLFNIEWERQDLKDFADKFPDMAMQEIGFGDLAIVDAFEKYIERVPGVSVRIWAMDGHLIGYNYTAPEIGRKRVR